ncbi:ABC transporter substrate-binding protein [Halogeometricum limi]|uniref:Peptide/nickel transport system substrate-binding protein n=1 Tax=Halogeometricum limi TaxID=555875 RepID=A0A1I6H9Y3_9EURY|nr:ABC transporter substrate-binding protein [Halogeometricum limi]SFR51262.1 peptide/nickel transport system substrate-binding protein [Halogeometricum limi]
MPDENKTFHSQLNRRRVLQGIGGAGIAGLAGCAGGSGDETEGTGTSSGGDSSGGDSTESESTEGGQSSGGKLRIALVKSPLEFDPLVLNDVPSSQVVDRVVEGLYTYDENTGIVPLLAEGSPTVENDGKRFTVTIKEGATFSNGDPVTAEDVKYSYEAPVAENTENASELNMIDTVEAVDERTVQFNLKYPYAPFKTTLTWYVVPKSVREEDKEAFNTGNSLVGSGPFTFEEWQEGNFARLAANPDYWGDPKPNLDEIEFVPVEEATTRVTTLKNGENDIIEEIPPKQYPTVRSIQDASIEEVPGIGYFYAAFNCNEGPTTDPKVREAIDYAFDMDQAVSSYVEPTGVRQYSPYPLSIAESWGFPLDEWKQIPHGKDVDQTKALLEEAGVPDDYTFKVIVPPDDKREQIGITISNGIKEAGWDATVQRLDWGAFLDKYVSGDESEYNIYTLGWSGTPDPDAFTYYLFGRDENTLGVTNGTFYGNNSEAGKQVSEKFIEARRTPEREERKALYEEATTTLLEDRVHLPAYNLKNSFGVKDYVEDFRSHPVSSFSITSDYNNVSVGNK